MVGLVTGREEDSRVPGVAYGWLWFGLLCFGEFGLGRVELVGLGFCGKKAGVVSTNLKMQEAFFLSSGFGKGLFIRYLDRGTVMRAVPELVLSCFQRSLGASVGRR